jgi:hypothetical protein
VKDSPYNEVAQKKLEEEVENFRISLGSEAESIAKRKNHDKVQKIDVVEARRSLYSKPSFWPDVYASVGGILLGAFLSQAIQNASRGQTMISLVWILPALAGLGLSLYGWLSKR